MDTEFSDQVEWIWAILTLGVFWILVCSLWFDRRSRRRRDRQGERDASDVQAGPEHRR